MWVSELIKRLEEIKSDLGDLEILIETPDHETMLEVSCVVYDVTTRNGAPVKPSGDYVTCQVIILTDDV